MNLRDQRNKTANDILKGVFVSRVLKEEGVEINTDINKVMTSAGFESSFWQDKAFSVTGQNTLEYRHKPQHRFVDMKNRNTKSGTIRKKRHAVHNKIIYGHLNDIARQLSFGYTQAVINELKQLEENKAAKTV
ncbi:hypothetical protein LIT13_01395 [Flavobacterium psychrophilum]|uniref:Uncharacterized protein n=1 Tax=Flavobacterium psychrophilum TaxID=96345 RepID=A0A7U2RQN4_FLAPS|nr:hypothetical protein [Flavobacterium psychrophilum]QCW20012.1 hypothetical protein [Flavobacterium phage FPSV-D15]QCW20229.1 hypothetical protein [Flavobacterium phage FPSV-F7]QCW20798.1 hypothetical protein [Flavobacterium phage FPSV-D35]AKC18959.1 hypothetical protein IY36_03990 [Flavobacterium psychrophilum]EKT3974020.1 hypothetical protein [Flavobacterium psychrophilum]